MLKDLTRRAVKLAGQARRRLAGTDRRVVRLEPDRRSRGLALFSYIIDPFLVAVPERIPYHHTHFWESWRMAQTLRELGFTVDCIHWANDRFELRESYDLLVDVRYNLERLAPALPAATPRILHCETAHLEFLARAELARLAALAARRGCVLQPRRVFPPSRSIEHATKATVLGNEFTQSTYAHAARPLRRVLMSNPFLYPYPVGRDIERARRRFVFYGSAGLALKGLDLVLEAFAAMPDLSLTVCGPIENERDFVAAYRRELYATPNIELVGWLDSAGPRFLEVMTAAIATILPSAAEGGGGSVITGMHAGLIPIVTREASVDIGDFGTLIVEPTVASVQAAVREVAELSPATLDVRARAAHAHVRVRHTRERFTAEYLEAARWFLGEA